MTVRVLQFARTLHGRRSVVVGSVSDLATIFESDIAVAVLTRAPNPELTDYVRRGFLQEESSRRLRITSDIEVLETVLPAAQAMEEGRRALLEDLTFLTELYRDLFGSEAVGLRLTSTSRATCPRFHVDRIGVRMTCTYGGPGTEWIDDPHVDRSKLGHGSGGASDEVSGLLLPGASIQRMGPFDIGLFKGEAWPGNEGAGAVHRSPLPPVTTRRLLVTLDGL